MTDLPAGLPQSIEGSYPAVAERVSQARRAVTLWLGALSADVVLTADIALAVSEACTNVVHHAYRDGGSGAFRVRAERVDGAICVTVSDDGAGVIPRSDSPGMGLGLPLMARLTDGLEIAVGDHGGTIVTMRFATAGARWRLAIR